jgi:hypothetical protein
MNRRTTERGGGIEDLTDGGEPVAPSSIPKYVHEGVEAQDSKTFRDLARWAEALAEYREQRPIEVENDEELVEVDETDESGGTTVVKKVPGGKDCGGCPHGPYE